jgi:hypothetical protein
VPVGVHFLGMKRINKTSLTNQNFPAIIMSHASHSIRRADRELYYSVRVSNPRCPALISVENSKF